ncbi:unnamed protein product [Cladocopium goreaui]|uniref:Leucine-rich repeat-containing protein 8D n=1 Tax=Cladocopium goreaui TaxID=2562237 RepID=A0A9P1DWE2_9DINO|nr:unnamed protein product [Cladocopium goreaui]
MSWLRAIFAEQIRNCCASNAIAFRSTRRKRRQRTQLTLQNEEAQLSLRASVREEAKVLELEHQLAAAEDDVTVLDRWYFGHCLEDQAEIMAIRDAEQTYLVRKRHLFQGQQEEKETATGLISPEREVFLDPQSHHKASERSR